MRQYAINVADLTYLPPFITSLLLDKLTTRTTVEAEKGRMDGAALVLDRAEPLQALCAISILASKAQSVMSYPLRAYEQGPRGGWRKLPSLAGKTVDDLEAMSLRSK